MHCNYNFSIASRPGRHGGPRQIPGRGAVESADGLIYYHINSAGAASGARRELDVVIAVEYGGNPFKMAITLRAADSTQDRPA